MGTVKDPQGAVVPHVTITVTRAPLGQVPPIEEVNPTTVDITLQLGSTKETVLVAAAHGPAPLQRVTLLAAQVADRQWRTIGTQAESK